ncbi:hypothetical protein [Natronorubrum texcoconense]|uniref:Uncharacterized protein n=1 Tax=Natronorubrum texcoconense TaxID=1095776 RepID=A0A1G8V6I0_9EURY|nr:hypothetical protein [Natronorubrum texcoconense]SDJ61678.1 hypothetical protein SAMN04515672_1195 [Natronorubrum texcoconense]
MVEDISRRNFVRNASASALAVGIAGLAGCTSSLPVVGDSSSGPGVENWLAAPSFADILDEDELGEYYEDPEFEAAEAGTRAFEYTVPEPFFDNEEETNAYSQLSTGSEFRSRVGVSATEIDWQLSSRTNWEFEFTHTERDRSGEEYEQDGSASTNVEMRGISGAFDPEDIEESLERWAEEEYDDEEELSSEGNREGLDLYEIDDSALAVGEEYVLQVTVGQHVEPIAALETVIDARWHGDELWVDDDDDARTLLDQLPSGDDVNGLFFEPMTLENAFEDEFGDEYDDIDELPDYQRESFEDQHDYDDWQSGLMGTISASEIDGETTDITTVFLYENERDADADALREHVDANRNLGEEWETLEDQSVSDEGRTLILTGTVRSRAVF